MTAKSTTHGVATPPMLAATPACSAPVIPQLPPEWEGNLMQILAAAIDQHGRLHLLVDRRPESTDLTWTPYPYDEPRPFGGDRQVGTLYVAVDPSGYVDFLADTGDPTGYNGAVFTLPLRDGTTREVVGPWSSSLDFVRHLVPELQLYTGGEVGLYVSQWSYEQRSGGWVAHLTADAGERLLALANQSAPPAPIAAAPALSPEDSSRSVAAAAFPQRLHPKTDGAGGTSASSHPAGGAQQRRGRS
ncbi:hypothetical protein AB0B10_25220 [Micromonospora arborensis]|uniref:hypothetical protein n=1 Tax=Micromonospora arborensis TaxID=2116518 RepID=UPI003403A90E